METVASERFIRVLSDYQARYPDVAVSLSTGTSPELYEQVLNHQLDGAFVTGNFDSASIVYEYTILDDVHLIAKKTDDSLQPAQTAWVVFPNGCPFRQMIEEWSGRAGTPIGNVIEVKTLDTLLNCVRAGLASTVLPLSVIAEEQKHLFAHTPMPEPFRYTHTRFIRRKDRFITKSFKAFVERLRVNGI